MPVSISSGFPVVNATPGRNAFTITDVTQLSYELSDTPIRDSLSVSINGLEQIIDDSFDLTGKTISFMFSSYLRVGDRIEVKYLYKEE